MQDILLLCVRPRHCHGNPQSGSVGVLNIELAWPSYYLDKHETFSIEHDEKRKVYKTSVIQVPKIPVFHNIVYSDYYQILKEKKL